MKNNMLRLKQSSITNDNLHKYRILILDFGSQYTQLIARRIREIGVYCEIHPYYVTKKDIINFAPQGIILSGGPETVTTTTTARAPDIIFSLGCPILGICYGMQTMVLQQGGKVTSQSKGEFGYARVAYDKESPLFHSITNELTLDVWMSHGDHVKTLPTNFKEIAQSNNDFIAAIADAKNNFYGMQFHPEVSNTEQGQQILKNFVVNICGCQALWKPHNIIEESINHIRTEVGNDHVLLAVSGGVDSSVLAVLLHQALSKQLHCVFIDNGLLRLNERDQVMTSLKVLGIQVDCISAADEFLQALKGVTDPDEKRKIIGRKFIKIFEEYAQKFDTITWLAQGTIYPDVIESGHATSGKAAVIKPHHNVGGLPEHMQLRLLEPLKELFKDEVRNIGLELGLPKEIINRHPFPGPGLAIRILGEVKESYLKILRQADALFIEELRNHKLYDNVSQAFVVFLPVKSVGVKGDARHYEYVITLRAVETTDFMTAKWASLPYKFLAHVANRILNEVNHVSRVTYDISSKPPATIEWE